MQSTNFPKALSAVLAVLAAIGIGCWIFQLLNGLAVTGMSNSTSWGLYIACFMLFVGLSAGGLIVASSAHVFNIESFKSVSLPAVILSTVSICCAGAFILIDLGGLQRIWRLFTGPNVTSPLFWDVCVISVYLIINVLDIMWMVKGDERKVAVLSRFALPVAILVHSVTAWIFGLQIAHEGWYSAIMAPIFVASAMDSGLALLLISLVGLEKLQLYRVNERLFSSLAGLLAVCIAVDAYFIGCELLTMAYPGTEAGAAVLSHMIGGATAPFFWFEIIGGLAVPFCVLVFAKNRKRRMLVMVSSALVILGVACKRLWLLFTNFITPNICGGPGIAGGSPAARSGDPASLWAIAGTYAPTPFELLIVTGVVALGMLGFIVLSSFILRRKNASDR